MGGREGMVREKMGRKGWWVGTDDGEGGGRDGGIGRWRGRGW